jgi:hypothetical protein
MAFLSRNVGVGESKGDAECTDGYENLLGVQIS